MMACSDIACNNNFSYVKVNRTVNKNKITKQIGSYGFCTPVTHTEFLIEININFQAPKTLQTNY